MKNRCPKASRSQNSQLEEAPMDIEALNALNLMANTLAQAQGFSVTIRAGFDVVQDTGQKITFAERRQVTLSRPDRLRIEAEESDGKTDPGDLRWQGDHRVQSR